MAFRKSADDQQNYRGMGANYRFVCSIRSQTAAVSGSYLFTGKRPVTLAFVDRLFPDVFRIVRPRSLRLAFQAAITRPDPQDRFTCC